MPFPDTEDSFTNPSAGQPLNNPSQSQIIAAIHAALAAIEAKVGVDNSDETSSHDFKIRALQEALDEIDVSDLTIADIEGLQAALDAKSNVGHTHTKAEVGLPNVDNTSDLGKPISTATQSGLDGKQPLDTDLSTIAAIDSGTSAGVMATDGSGWIKKSYAALKTAMAFVKGDVGLGNVDNTSDTNKPVSTAQQTALDGKQTLDSDLTTIAAINSAGSGVLAADGAGWILKTYSALKTALSLTKSDVGLANVDNTSDANKPVSTATQTAIDTATGFAKTKKVTFVLDTPTSSDVFPIVQVPYAATITKVTGSIVGGTSLTFQIQKRSATTLNSSGTNALTSSMVADQDGTTTTSFSSASITAYDFLVLVASAISGTVNQVVITIEFTQT